MKYVFRVDSSLTIGGGHLVRCLNLAKYINKNTNAEITFVCAKAEGSIHFLVKEAKFNLIEIDVDSSVLNNNPSQEVSLLSQLASKDTTLIIDHYDINILIESSLKAKFNKVVVVDDLANRKHDCDLLVDYNYYLNEKRYEGLLSQGTAKCFGPQYCILSDKFVSQPVRAKKPLENILIFFGSNDSHNLCSKVYKALGHQNRFHFNIVVGKNSPHNNELLTLEKENENLKVHVQTSDMYGLMCNSDLYIGSGGTVTWERLFCGLPSLVVSVADNQVESCKDLHMSRYIEYVGHYTEDRIQEKISKKFDQCLNANLIEILKSGQSLVDGKGSELILKKISSLLSQS